jgi:uncharacterized protein
MSARTIVGGWRRFWNAGGWWRSLLLVAVYYGLFTGLSFVVVSPIATRVGSDPVASIWVDYALPIALGGVLLLLFGWSLGWLPALFGPQLIGGAKWMWIGVAVPLLFAALHWASIDYRAAGAGTVLAWIVSGLCIGFAEEVLTRGFVVTLLRRAGYRELAVASVSSALFALLHAGNLLAGQALGATLFQLVYTFAFGICMYLCLRVTRHILWPILLHAATDPSTALMSEHPAGALVGLAGVGNIAVIVTGLVLLFFVQGRVGGRVLLRP